MSWVFKCPVLFWNLFRGCSSLLFASCSHVCSLGVDYWCVSPVLALPLTFVSILAPSIFIEDWAQCLNWFCLMPSWVMSKGKTVICSGEHFDVLYLEFWREVDRDHRSWRLKNQRLSQLAFSHQGLKQQANIPKCCRAHLTVGTNRIEMKRLSRAMLRRWEKAFFQFYMD